MSEDWRDAPSWDDEEWWWVGEWERGVVLTGEKVETILYCGGSDGSRKEKLVAQVKWYAVTRWPYH